MIAAARRLAGAPDHRSLPMPTPADAPVPALEAVPPSVAFARPSPAPATEAVVGLHSLRDWVRWAQSRLQAAGACFGHGTENAHDEALWLLLWALHLPLDDPQTHLDAVVLPAEATALCALIERRCGERIPSAYLTGEAWLRGLCFKADPRALIPRSVIVEALDESLNDWLPADPPQRILDLCTGGGSIAIASALRFPTAPVDATDLSAQALELAAENRARYRLSDRIDLFQGDLYDALGTRRYDLILSNPPYVNAASMADLPPEFRHEPRGALAGGIDGMDLVRRIVRDGLAHLLPAGLLVIEIGHEAEHFEAAFDPLEFAYLPVTAGERMIVAITREAIAAWASR